MRAFWSIFRREFVSYFATPLAYLFLAIFALATSWATFSSGFFEARQATLRLFFENLPWVLVVLVPALAMRLWAEERRSNSIELLFTLPTNVTQAVLGKFVACWAVIAVALALTFPIVLTVSYLGDPDPGPMIAGYVGSFLLAGTYLAVGGFFSCLTRNQVIAFVLGVVVCGVLLFAGSPVVLNFVGRALPLRAIEAIETLSLQIRYESLLRGVIELRDVAFFAVLTAGWLGATVVALKEKMGQ
jgi:ABC-2 type transport system permease protein